MGRMWKAGPIGSFGGRMTLRPFLEVKTIKEFDKGYAINWVHQPKFRQVDVTLDYCTVEIDCRSCDRVIQVGEIFGNGTMEFNGKHCVDCLQMPDGVLAVHVVYKTRKSVRRPDGIEKVLVVHNREAIDEFVDQLEAELKREIHIEEIPVVVNVGVMQ